MPFILTTLIACAAILGLWFGLGSFNSQPDIPLPTPSYTLEAEASIEADESVPSPIPDPVLQPTPQETHNTSSLTPDELILKAKLEKNVLAELPTHRITFDKFRTLTGWIVSETSNQVTFSESYGTTGSMSVRISRKRIVSIEALTNLPPVITDRDVRFHAEFPRFNFFKRHPYTVVTDESFFQVERIVRDLQKTYGQFSARFRPLVQLDRAVASDIQVLVFSSQDAFHRYARQYFHATNDIAGFYRVDADRLIVFNQTTANWIQTVIDKEAVDAIATYGDTPEIRQQLADRRGARENDLKWFAKQFTLETVRHEGAHQMSYTLGVLRLYPRNMSWLSEGLAIYSETDRIGDIHRWRVEELKHRFPNKVYPDIADVIASSYEADYLTSYSSYWALTHFLMETKHRNAFFQFIGNLNNPETWQERPLPSDLDLLCRGLGTDPTTLDQEWHHFLERL